MLFLQIKEIVKEIKEIFGGFETPDEAVLISQSLDYLKDKDMNICDNKQDELKFTIWLRDKVKQGKKPEKNYDYSLKSFDEM